MKKYFAGLIFLLIFIYSFTSQQDKPKKPKLVIGIVIDQMRYDYLTRFADRYSDKGFKRLLKGGFSLENAHYNYIPTYTAPGHASIFTGTTPTNHGIISNNWYDKKLKETIYCVDDNNYETAGNTGDVGKKSPKRLYTTTVTDQLHLAQNMNGKTIGIAIKDRSSILPAGHTANAAYWFDGDDFGGFVSSTFYMNELPKWVQNFNNNGMTKYINQPWETMYDIKTYTNSLADDNIYEGLFKGEEKPIFPKDISKLSKTNGNFDIIKGIPAGNTMTVDFAKAAIINENLGKSKYTDFLTLSFSSTDYVGHQFGLNSVEIEDTYLRLDKDLGDFFDFLDKQVGAGNYTLFLTADHAAVQVPAYLESIKIPAHYLNTKKFRQFALEITKKYFNSEKLIENISNFQIFLDKDAIEAAGFEVTKVADKLAEEVIHFDGVYKSITAEALRTTDFSNGIFSTLQNGYNQKFSGDVLIIPYPNTLTGSRTGTSHGSGNSYDTHVPVIFYGNGIKKGSSAEKYEIVDIAPTISNLLQIEFPNGNTGKVITEVLEK
jgi:predicted AlkP superfamily pyrophosphatase or phosphodiesterase